MNIGGKGVPGRRNSKCKDLEAGTGLEGLRSQGAKMQTAPPRQMARVWSPDLSGWVLSSAMRCQFQVQAGKLCWTLQWVENSCFPRSICGDPGLSPTSSRRTGCG